jgi:hypothetical protein
MRRSCPLSPLLSYINSRGQKILKLYKRFNSIKILSLAGLIVFGFFAAS